MAVPIRSALPASDRPDAVTFPRGNLPPSLNGDQRELMVELAEHHLQCGPHELAWVRDQLGSSGNYFFATRCPEDSEFYPTGHARSGEPRYRWTYAGVGVKLGWLKHG